MATIQPINAASGQTPTSSVAATSSSTTGTQAGTATSFAQTLLAALETVLLLNNSLQGTGSSLNGQGGGSLSSASSQANLPDVGLFLDGLDVNNPSLITTSLQLQSNGDSTLLNLLQNQLASLLNGTSGSTSTSQGSTAQAGTTPMAGTATSLGNIFASLFGLTPSTIGTQLGLAQGQVTVTQTTATGTQAATQPLFILPPVNTLPGAPLTVNGAAPAAAGIAVPGPAGAIPVPETVPVPVTVPQTGFAPLFAIPTTPPILPLQAPLPPNIQNPLPIALAPDLAAEATQLQLLEGQQAAFQLASLGPQFFGLPVPNLQTGFISPLPSSIELQPILPSQAG